MKESPRTQVFYEAPHRLLETLADVVEVSGSERHVVVAREVTKLHEEFLRGRAGEILDELKSRGDVKGEITLLIAKQDEFRGAGCKSRADCRTARTRGDGGGKAR